MIIKLTYNKCGNSYSTILPEIVRWYVKEPDGLVYTEIIDPLGTSDQIVEKLFCRLAHRHIVTKRVAVILNLLANPYFEETCEYVRVHCNDLPKNVKRLLIKYMFSYLADDFQYQMWKLIPAERNIYDQKNMYETSKEMLKLLSQQ